MIELIVHGAAGRMGRRVLALAAERAAEFAIVAGVDREPGTLRGLGIASEAPLLTETPARPGAVVVDFSHHSAFASLVQHCAAHGMALVSGTTGIAPEVVDRELAAAAARIACLHAGNMSVGVTVLLDAVARLAKALGEGYDIEIVEAHHRHKADAPSGTALALADAIAAATGRTRRDYCYGRQGQTGARRSGEIGIHALRLGDVVGDHTVWFVGRGERILVGHIAHTRDIFAEGALRAAAFLAQAGPGRYSMRQVLGLA
ncbi:MAG: 4-hydroxy-tetrahydrodipicolinate reductase [Planctomycetota bacterium]|nr:4-hydroxy-tetrahydrodipicolinate reductase [Planctomycetota bacterium]